MFSHRAKYVRTGVDMARRLDRGGLDRWGFQTLISSLAGSLRESARNFYD